MTHHHCDRCETTVGVVAPWSGFQPLWKAWLFVLVLLLLASPVVATDLMLMLPLAALYLAGGSTLYRLSKVSPTCRVCGYTISA